MTTASSTPSCTPPKNEWSPQEILNLIFSYVGRIAGEKSLDNLLLLMADMGRELVMADRCTLWLHDPHTHELWTKVAHGLDHVRIPDDKGFAGFTVKHKEALLIDDAYQDPRFNPSVDKSTGYRTRSVLAIPIQNNEGTIMGAYQAINKMTEGAVFTKHDLEYLTLAATYSGKALESAILYHEIELTQKEVIFTMGQIGESRSKETGNHVKRVAEYSTLLAEKAGLAPEEVDLLRMCSPMHDIGKVAIPDCVLNKPGKLTDEEFSLIKTHTEIGHNLLASSTRKIIQNAAIIAYQHHEKWDGSGYPRGLKGENIHIFGRITAIADVFDALGSDRVYKKSWPLERILELFQSERGRQFDPQLMDIFLENIEAFVAIRDMYKDDV